MGGRGGVTVEQVRVLRENLVRERQSNANLKAAIRSALDRQATSQEPPVARDEGEGGRAGGGALPPLAGPASGAHAHAGNNNSLGAPALGAQVGNTAALGAHATFGEHAALGANASNTALVLGAHAGNNTAPGAHATLGAHAGNNTALGAHIATLPTYYTHSTPTPRTNPLLQHTSPHPPPQSHPAVGGDVTLRGGGGGVSGGGAGGKGRSLAQLQQYHPRGNKKVC